MSDARWRGEKQRILAAILDENDRSWFIKMTGDRRRGRGAEKCLPRFSAQPANPLTNVCDTASPNDFLRPLRFLASLRLTVVCLGFGMLLIFLGTLAQVHLGIHARPGAIFPKPVRFLVAGGRELEDSRFCPAAIC